MIVIEIRIIENPCLVRLFLTASEIFEPPPDKLTTRNLTHNQSTHNPNLKHLAPRALESAHFNFHRKAY